MGHVFQAEWWEKILGIFTFDLFMDMEIGKGIGEGKEAINGISL